MKKIFDVKIKKERLFYRKDEKKLKRYNDELDDFSILNNRNINSLYPFLKVEKIKNKSFKFNSFQNKYIFEEKKNNKKEYELNNEIYKEIKLLWIELGLKNAYQEEFESFLVAVDNKDRRMKYLIYERDNLLQFKKSLLKFMKEKQFRRTNIESLKELNNKIYLAYVQDKNIESSLIKEIIDYFKNIRISSINLIKNIIKIRENLSLFFNEDKIDLDILYKKFHYDNNYLLKLNFELQFLNSSEINKLFEKNNDECVDTFLTTYSYCKNNEETFVLKLSKEILTSIEKCRYYIFQEGILNNLKSLTKISQKRPKKRLYVLNKSYLCGNVNKDYVKTTKRNSLNLSLISIKSKLGKKYGKLFFNSFKRIKIPKNLTNKKRSFNSEPKKNIIIIEREDFRDNNRYMNNIDKKLLNSFSGNIQIKEKTNYINFNSLNSEKNDNINLSKKQYQTENINQYCENEKIINKEEYKNNVINSKDNIENEKSIKSNEISMKDNNEINYNNKELKGNYENNINNNC